MARIKEYWLQLENRRWDASPWGFNRLTGMQMTRTADGAFRAVAREVLVIRRYTADWGQPDDRPLNSWDLAEPDPVTSGGTIPGAMLTAKVADEIVVHFRNLDERVGIPEPARAHSLHPRGAQQAAEHGGVFPLSPPDPAQGGRRGDRVMPGETFTYRWTCPHRASAGTWLYHDASVNGSQHIALGAFGILVIQAPGEQMPDVPATGWRDSGDTSTRFAAVPTPPKRADYLLAFHELPGIGLCLNGRVDLGNTPVLVTGEGTRMTVRCVNATPNPVTVAIQGHRWERGGGNYSDTELLPPGNGTTFAILAGSAEGGGGPGEWLVTGRSGNQVTYCTFVTTKSGPLALPSA
ncbi:MAG: multicopper oxidase domain-containing protein [Chloroflexota bacterium]|jgi:hypothetical protein